MEGGSGGLCLRRRAAASLKANICLIRVAKYLSKPLDKFGQFS